jgi:chromosome segregation ATPase
MADDLNLLLGRLAGAQMEFTKRQEDNHSENKERLTRIEGELRTVRHGQANLLQSVTLLQDRMEGQARQIRAHRRSIEEQDRKIDEVMSKMKLLLYGLSAVGTVLGGIVVAFSKTIGVWLGAKMGFMP